jgi:hypothetical protein
MDVPLVADSKVSIRLRTGGKSGSSKRNLFSVQSSATGFRDLAASQEGPFSFFGGVVIRPINGYTISKTDIEVPSFGRLGTNGYAYAILAGNSEVDITPATPEKYYSFSVSPMKHRLGILANGNPCEIGSFVQPTFITGQDVTFSASWDNTPPGIQGETNKWFFSGNFKNDATNAISGGSMPTSSDAYFANLTRMTNAVLTNNWWVSGGFSVPDSYPVSLDKGLMFNNGQHLNIVEIGSINMYRPQGKITATTGSVVLDTNMMVGHLNCAQFFGLHFGNPSGCGGTPGIAFTSATNIPSGFSGSVRWVQVINSFVVRYQTNDGTDAWFRWAGTNGLDNTHPYSSAVNKGGANCWVAKKLTEVADFDMWLEFLPTGGGHWVPLRKVHWSWGGEATLFGVNCVNEDWSGGNFTSTPNPIDAEAQEYPRWTNRILNQPNYQPE